MTFHLQPECTIKAQLQRLSPGLNQMHHKRRRMCMILGRRSRWSGTPAEGMQPASVRTSTLGRSRETLRMRNRLSRTVSPRKLKQRPCCLSLLRLLSSSRKHPLCPCNSELLSLTHKQHQLNISLSATHCCLWPTWRIRRAAT